MIKKEKAGKDNKLKLPFMKHCKHTREVKQNFLSNVPAADSHPNYSGILLSYWIKLILTGCSTSCVAYMCSLNLLW